MFDLGEVPHGPGLVEVAPDRYDLAVLGVDAHEDVVHADVDYGISMLDDGGPQRPQEGLRFDEVRDDRGQRSTVFPEGPGH